MTSFFRRNADTYDVIATNLAWRQHVGIKSGSHYLQKFDSLFENHTSIGVRSADNGLVSVGVIKKSSEPPASTKKTVSAAMQLRQHSQLLTFPNVTEASDAESVTVYMAKLHDDTWYMAGFIGRRVVIDTTIDASDLPSINRDINSPNFEPTEFDDNFIEIIDDLFTSQHDAYSINVVLIEVESELAQTVCDYTQSLPQFAGRISIDVGHKLDGSLDGVISSTIDKTSYFGNVKSYRVSDNRTKAFYLIGLTLVAMIAGYAYNANLSQPKLKVDSGAFDKLRQSAQKKAPQPQVIAPKAPSKKERLEEVNLLLSRIKTQEYSWLEQHIRKTGFNSTLTLKKELSRLYGEKNGYALESAVYLYQHELGQAEPNAKIVAQYLRKESTSTLGQFVASFENTNPTLSGDEVIVTKELPSAKYDKDFDINAYRHSSVELISWMQSYKKYEVVSDWTLNKVEKELERPIPLAEKNITLLNSFLDSSVDALTYVHNVDVYRLTVQTKFLKSLKTIDEIIRVFPSSTLSKVTYHFPTSSITSEIYVYDIRR